MRWVGDPARARPRELSATEVAWMVLLPCVAAAVIAIIALGPPLGRVLFAPGPDRLWPPGWWETAGRAEPAKQGRYILAALAPLLFAGAIVVGSRRRVALRASWVRPLVYGGYAVVLGLVGWALLDQNVMYGPGIAAPALVRPSALAFAGIFVAVVVIAMRSGRIASRVAALARETTTRRWAAFAAVAAFLAIWLLTSVYTDRMMGDAPGPNLTWTMNDALAVLDGRTPLVDYHVIYAKLLPYPSALALAVFGTTTLVYTTFMAALNGLVLLAVYDVFRLVARSSLLALALLVCFVATSDVNPGTNPIGLGSPLTMPAVWPMRYGGVYLLAWLVARHIAGRWPRRPATIFLFGTLAAVNALEFGAGALLATVAALLCTRPPRSRRDVIRLVTELAAGAGAAIAIVALGTYARAGELPRLGVLLEWPQIFTRLGWFSMPLPTWGLHIAIYATFVAALVAAAVRSSQRHDGRALTGMLAWAGTFGLFAGSYYVGRPDVYKLTTILSAWSFALTMLTVACILELSGRGWRRPTLPQLLVLFAFGLSVSTLSGFPMPQQHIERLTTRYPDPRYELAAERFVREQTQPGETVAILIPMSYRISHALHVRNVAPYGFMNAIVTREAMRTLITTLRQERVQKVFTPVPGSRLLAEGDAAEEQVQALADIGFRPTVSVAGIGAFAASDDR